MEKSIEKLLIVDDSELMLEMLSRSIRRICPKDADMSILTAASCAEARKVFKACRPGTVILDIALPDGSGINLLDEFRNDMHNAMPDIFMLTSLNAPEIRKKCLTSGATAFFDKSSLSTFLVFLETKLNNTIDNKNN